MPRYTHLLLDLDDTLYPDTSGVWEAVRDRIQHFIDMVDLTGFERSYPHELSGGMKKRVMIIRLLAADADVLFMDEPSGALDVFTREMLQDEILKLWQATRKTILFVTHDIA